MNRVLVLVAVLLAACGDSGEPMKGDVVVTYGGSSPKMDVGTAVQDEETPGKMLVQFGTDEVDCDSYLDVFLDFNLPEGTFVYFSVDKMAGTYASASVSAMKNTSRSTSINSTTGMVTITAVEPRVTGTVTFTTTDEEVGVISATGSFDVKRCF
ncbi:MAG: hypothetical protein H0T46_30195 [Deltaproteobacteria bacterium]|nr:hypothetical protein [Deltaproteobacteria bacterium]